MDHSDYVSFIIGGLGVVTLISGWILRLGTRVTKTEVMQENNSRRITENQLRTAADFQDIKGALYRIEDLVGRNQSLRRNGE